MEAQARLLWKPRRAGAFPVRRLSFSPPVGYEPSFSTNPPSECRPGGRTRAREWLVTNGLGGYASGTISGIVTRRYHGLLVSALPAPIGRTVMLSAVDAWVRLPSGQVLALDPDPPDPAGVEPPEAGPQPGKAWRSLESLETMSLAEFRLEAGLPVWRYEGEGLVIEKRVLMPYRQNTVHLTYRLIEGAVAVRLELRPFMHVRHYESALRAALPNPYALTAVGSRFDVLPGGDLPALHLPDVRGRVGADPRRVGGPSPLSRRTIARIRT